MTTPPKPVLILGARSDIARAMAAEFALRGHPLMLAARDAARLQRDVSDLTLRHGAEVSAHEFDALDLAGYAGFFDALPRDPAIVICAVGMLGDQETDIHDPVALRRIVDTNFTGPARALEIAAQRLAASDGFTAIVGIGSVAGDRGRAKNYLYGAAKAGFAEYLSGLRQKYARSGLHVMTVKPGFVRTSMTEGMDLPGALTTSPDAFAARVVRALERRRMVYYDMRWRVLMSVIRLIPERLFSRMRF